MKSISSPLGSRQSSWMFRLARLILAGALFIASSTPARVLAQAVQDPWAEPQNLSHSGVAYNPAFVIDSEEVLHAVWQNDLGNYVYSEVVESDWSVPVTTDLNRLFGLPSPEETTNQNESSIYTGPNPVFIPGPGEYVYGFWLSQEGRLFASSVENQDFDKAAAWASGRLISPSAASFAAAVDALGGLHLAYYRLDDDPASPTGIYYTRSNNNGRSWAAPVLLYESLYLRSLEEGEANLSLATAGTEDTQRIYVAWDNRPRKEVLLAQSVNGGESWEQPVIVAGPAPDSGLAGPFNIHVGANENSAVLVWQSGQPDSTCTQLYQASTDGGATWSEPLPMLEELVGCARSNTFVTGLANSPESPFFLLTESQNQVFLTAWNGLQWSETQVQPVLAGFEDPEIFRQVDYGCHRASLSGERLYLIGCDEGGGGDIWVTYRDLEADASWFTPPVWSQLSPVSSDPLEVQAVELAATEDDLIHAFFSLRQDPVIYHTYWNGELWSRISPALEPPDGEAGWPAVAAGPGNELFLISRNDQGALFFSRATSDSAVAASGWSTPTRLGISHDGEVGSVDIAWDAAGTIYVVYSVPVNEERGIYLVQSKDHGATWSEALQVFDGAAAGFNIVGAPSLLASANGILNIIWKQQSIQGDGAPQSLSLYSTRSEDGGLTFDAAKVVVQEPVGWREIATDEKGDLHLVWQGQDSTTTVWDQTSLDGGLTWQIPQGLPNEGRLAAITSDPGGRLHLVGVAPGSLGHWYWDGSRWQSEASLALAVQPENPVESLAAAINKQGKMVVLLAAPAGAGGAAENAGGAAESALLYSARTLELPPIQAAIQEVPTQTLPAPTLTPATPTPERSLKSTPAVDNKAANQGQKKQAESRRQIGPLQMALLPVALLVVSFLGLVIRRAARVKHR
jgi:hypothetical protein